MLISSPWYPGTPGAPVDNNNKYLKKKKYPNIDLRPVVLISFCQTYQLDPVDLGVLVVLRKMFLRENMEEFIKCAK